MKQLVYILCLSGFISLAEIPSHAAVIDGLGDGKKSAPLDAKPDWDQAFNKSIGHLMIQAGQAYESGRIDECLEKVLQAKRRMPLNREVQLALAHVYIRLNRIEDAFQELYVLLNREPKNPGYLRLVGYCYESMGQYEEALEIYDRFARIARGHEKPEMYRGGVYFKMGKIDEAIDAYAKAVRLNPDTAVTHEALGAAWLQAERYDEAVTSFKRAIKLDPEFARAYNSLGTALYKTEHYQEGMDHVNRAIQIDPDYAQAYNNLASMYAQHNQARKAMDLLSRALELDLFSGAIWHNTLKGLDQVFVKVPDWTMPSPPDDAEDPSAWHREQAMQYTDDKDTPKAVRHLIQAIRLSPNNALNYNDLGTIIAKTDFAGMARHFFRLALAIDADYELARNNLLALKQFYGKHVLDRQIKSLEKRILAEPGNASAHYALGMLYANSGNLTNAIPHLVQTVQLSPTNISVRLNLSLVLYEAGKGQAALESLLSALDLDIRNLSAWKRMITALGFMLRKPDDWKLPHPENPKTGLEYAQWHYQEALKYDINSSNEWWKAAAHAYASIGSIPEVAGAFDLMGQITFRQLTPRIAVPFFRFALVLEEDSVATRQRLEMAEDAAKQVRQNNMRSRLVELLKQNPNDPFAALNLGIDLAERGRLDQATRFFKRAYDALPQNREIALKYGRALFATGSKAEALEVLDKSLSQDSDHPILLYRVAWLLMEIRGDDSAARERAFLLNRLAIERAKPKVPAEMFRNLARIQHARGNSEDARSAIAQAIAAAERNGTPEAVEELQVEAKKYLQP